MIPREGQAGDGAHAESRVRLAGTRPEPHGHRLPEGQPGEGAREVQDDPAGRDLHAGPELEQPLAERPDLEARRRGGREPGPQGLEQDVRGGREKDAERVGPEAGAARAVEAEAVVEFLQPVLHVPALAVDLVDPPRPGWRGRCPAGGVP
jgi:hypothetical protein